MEAVSQSQRFASFHQWDRRFFALFLALCWIGVMGGFFRAASLRIAGRADYPAPPILFIHAVLFVSWMILLSLQVILIRTKRLRIHKRLGQIGYLLVPLMVYSGIAAELHGQRFYIQRDDDDLHYLILTLILVLGFALFGAAALFVAKRDSVSHKRLIILATSMIVAAAYARWWGRALMNAVGDGYWGTIINNFAGLNLLLAVAVGFDILTRGRPHRVYVISVPVVLVAELIGSNIYHSAWWVTVARHLIELRLPLSA